jgi:hypothetical protein
VGCVFSAKKDRIGSESALGKMESGTTEEFSVAIHQLIIQVKHRQ